MGRNVKFAGQSITAGLCWSANDNCGALNELATGFNVWKYFITYIFTLQEFFIIYTYILHRIIQKPPNKN